MFVASCNAKATSHTNAHTRLQRVDSEGRQREALFTLPCQDPAEATPGFYSANGKKSYLRDPGAKSNLSGIREFFANGQLYASTVARNILTFNKRHKTTHSSTSATFNAQ